jgi:hypothetical protein
METRANIILRISNNNPTQTENNSQRAHFCLGSTTVEKLLLTAHRRIDAVSVLPPIVNPGKKLQYTVIGKSHTIVSIETSRGGCHSLSVEHSSAFQLIALLVVTNSKCNL